MSDEKTIRNVIIGTAGHIDHGKTTLVKALTGRSTDKLKEEIKRGISINLGFTYFDLPSGKRAGIIDVPGHERFIKNMLAGASGIDIVLLTIAANEGVKPQTIEHVDILSCLDVKERLIVLTKCDLADDVMLELVKDDIAETLRGTFFDGAEICEVDSLSLRGMDALIAKIDLLTDNVKTKNERAACRLPIDRIFTLKGFGTVVTGTLSEGKISIGDELMIYPKMLKAKIRSVQVHDKTVDVAYAGQRTALNISSVKADEIERGDVLAQPGSMTPTSFIDAKITLIAHSKVSLSLWDRVRIYLGSNEVLARVVPLDCDKVASGETAFFQLRLEKEAVAKKNDKFVIRTFSPLHTIGGGVVLDPNPKKHGKADKRSLESLKISDTPELDTLVEEFIRKNGETYTSASDVCAYATIDEAAANEILNNLSEQGAIFKINKHYFHVDTIEKFETDCIALLSDYHNKYPLRVGMLKEELKSKCTKLKLKEFSILLNKLADEKTIILTENSYVSIFGFKIVYNEKQQKIKENIEKTLYSAGFSPPFIADVISGDKAELEVFESLADRSVVKLDAQTAIHKEFYERAKKALFDFMAENEKITLAEFRDLSGSSRKYAMLLLDDFDRRGITMRLGDARVLRSGKQ